jgi:preprotein translocase subunit YajC
MVFASLIVVCAPTMAPILAQAAPAGQGGDPNAMLKTVLMMGVVFAVFYFVIIRPQQKQDKQRRAMLDILKKRDQVVFGGGIHGTVMDVGDDEVTVRISENPDVRVRVRRSAVTEVQPS